MQFLARMSDNGSNAYMKCSGATGSSPARTILATSVTTTHTVGSGSSHYSMCINQTCSAYAILGQNIRMDPMHTPNAMAQLAACGQGRFLHKSWSYSPYWVSLDRIECANQIAKKKGPKKVTRLLSETREDLLPESLRLLLVLDFRDLYICLHETKTPQSGFFQYIQT